MCFCRYLAYGGCSWPPRHPTQLRGVVFSSSSQIGSLEEPQTVLRFKRPLLKRREIYHLSCRLSAGNGEEQKYGANVVILWESKWWHRVMRNYRIILAQKICKRRKWGDGRVGQQPGKVFSKDDACGREALSPTIPNLKANSSQCNVVFVLGKNRQEQGQSTAGGNPWLLAVPPGWPCICCCGMRPHILIQMMQLFHMSIRLLMCCFQLQKKKEKSLLDFPLLSDCSLWIVWQVQLTLESIKGRVDSCLEFILATILKPLCWE